MIVRISSESSTTRSVRGFFELVSWVDMGVQMAPGGVLVGQAEGLRNELRGGETILNSWAPDTNGAVGLGAGLAACLFVICCFLVGCDFFRQIMAYYLTPNQSYAF